MRSQAFLSLFVKAFSRFIAVLGSTVMISFFSFPQRSLAAPPLNFQNQFVLSVDVPISLAFLPDGHLLVVQKEGKILLADPQEVPVLPRDYMSLTNIDFGGERGLLDITLDPDFAINRFFYLYYSADSPRRFRVSRFTHVEESHTGDLASELILWEDHEDILSCCHVGGGLDFGPDGKLYVTMGDEFFNGTDSSGGAVAQDLSNTAGSVLRLNPDGTIPADKPFVGIPNALPEIWAYGLRNPYRARWDLDPGGNSGRYFIGEVGGNDQGIAFEEINLGAPGANFGWPHCEGPAGNPDFPTCDGALHTDPLFSYRHGGFGASMTAGMVYRGDAFPATYQGAFFYGDYTRQFIRYLTFDATGTVVTGDFEFEPAAGLVIFIEEGPDGALYYTKVNGEVRRIAYLDQAPICQNSTASPTSGAPPLEIAFTATATDDQADSLEYHWTFGDGSEASVSGLASGQQATTSHTYTAKGRYPSQVQVSDGIHSTTCDPIEIQVGFPPMATIDFPADGLFFRAGDLITFSGSATDSDGPLAPADFSWIIRFLHNNHTHPAHGPVIGTSGSFEVPSNQHDFQDDTGFEITLTVTDADGLQDVQSVILLPEKVDVTFETVPPGLQLTIDGLPTNSPTVFDTLIGFEHVVHATAQCYQGSQYEFSSWSDGGNANHGITVPDTDLTLTATFTPTESCFPLNGLVLHLDAAEGVTVSTTGEGTAVTAWADQSSAGNDVAVTGGSPSWVAEGLNGLPIITFDGLADGMGRAAPGGLPTADANRSAFMVVNYLSKGTGGFAYGNTVANGAFGLVVTQGTGRLGVQGWGAENDFQSSVSGEGSGWLRQSVVVEGGHFSHLKDGEEIDSADHTWATGSDLLRIGVELDNSPAIAMEVAEIMLYNRALEEAEQVQVEAYLAQKYFPVVNQGPTGVLDARAVPPGGSVDIDLLANDFDPEGDTIQGPVGIVSQPAHGTITPLDPNSGVVRYQHDGMSDTDDLFTYTVQDEKGAVSNETTVRIHLLRPDFPDLEGLVLHLKSDFGVTTDTSGEVLAWLDVSGHRNDLAAVGDPAFGANGPNGQPFLQFDGGGDKLERTGTLDGMPGGNADRTVFAVTNTRGSNHAGFAYGSTDQGQGCASHGNRAFGLVADGLRKLTIQGWCLENDFHSSTLGTGEGWLVQSAVVQSDTLNHYKDGTLIDTRDHVFNTDASNGRIVLGAELDGTPFADMDVATVMVYNRALEPAERLQVEAFLQEKYLGIVLGNQPPVALNDFATVAPGAWVDIDVLANDFDVDGVPNPATVKIFTSPSHGVVSEINMLTGVIRYQHDGSGFSSDSFTYTFEDEVGAVSNAATVFVTTGPSLPVSQGLVLHLESDLGVTTNGGNLVAGWLDLSGHGNDLAAFGDPTLETDSPTAGPYLRFDGIDDRLQTLAAPTGLPTGNADRSMFTVVRYRDSGFGGVAYGKTACNQAFGLVVDDHDDLTVQAWCEDLRSNTVGTGASWLSQSAVLSSSLLQHFSNGTLIDETLHTFATNAEGTLVLGAELDGSPQLDMDIAAVLIYDRALVDAERLQVENYLQEKYLDLSSSPPVAVDDAGAVATSSSITLDVLANDLGLLAPSSVTITNPPSLGALLVDQLTGAITYSHGGSPATNDSFTYTVASLDGQTSNEATVSLSIFAVPAITSGLVLHLQADFGVSGSGSEVVGWQDLSGSGNHLLAVGAPTVVSAGLSGRDYLSLDGVDDRLERLAGLEGLPAGNADRTVFAVVNYHSTGFGGITWGATSAGLGCASGGNRAFGLVVDDLGKLGLQGWCLGNDFPSSATGTGSGWLSQSVVLEADTFQHFKNGALVDTRSHGFNTEGGGRLVLGAELDGSPTVAMDVAAVLVYDRALHAVERAEIENYLQQRYFNTPFELPQPMAGDDHRSVSKGGQVAIDILANDTSAEALAPATIEISGSPQAGQVTSIDPVSGIILYDHNPGSAAFEDRFTYTVMDELGQVSNEATVHLTIVPTAVGLVLHLESSNGLVASGPEVFGWRDLSPFGNDLLASGDPQRVSGGLNGQDFVQLDGLGDQLSELSSLLAFPAGSSDRSLFAVVRYLDTGFGGVSYGSAACNQAFGLVVDERGDLTVQSWCTDLRSTVAGTGSGWRTQSAVLASDVLAHYTNGSLIDSVAHTFATDGSGQFVIGAEIDHSPFLAMDVAAVLLYDNALTEMDRQEVEAYLQAKYLGISE